MAEPDTPADAVPTDTVPTDAADFLSDKALLQVAPELLADPPSKTSLQRLRDLQREHDSIYEEYVREKKLLEHKFEGKFVPLYSRRQEELKNSPIHDFWFKAFLNCELLDENITERDSIALEFLTDVSCYNVTADSDTKSQTKAADGFQNGVNENDDDKDNDKEGEKGTEKEEKFLPVGSFTLSFRFRENPFFENEVLTKTYVMHPDDYEDVAEAQGCQILWKKGMDVTARTMKKRGKNGRVLIKKQPTDSFFNFFSPPQGFPDSENDADSTFVEELEDVMEADYELGECIRSEVIPKALLFFLDLAEGSEDRFDVDDDDDINNDDDQEEDEDDEDGDDEDDEDENEDYEYDSKKDQRFASNGVSLPKGTGTGTGNVTFGDAQVCKVQCEDPKCVCE